MRGTHQGELMGIPPTGKQVTMTGMTIHRIVSGKIVEDWVVADFLGMMQQLGTIPTDREDFTWGEPSEVTGDPGNPEANKAITRRLFEEAVNQRNLSLVDDIFAANYIFHDPAAPDVRSREELKQFLATLLTVFPDAHVTLDYRIAEGDKVLAYATVLGTHQSEFMDIPPTDKQVMWTGVVINRFADGKIVEDWESFDALGLMQQLTATPVDTEANKAIARRVFEEVFNQRNLDLVDEIFAIDYVGHVPPNPDIHGPEGFKQFSAMLSAGFPDGPIICLRFVDVNHSYWAGIDPPPLDTQVVTLRYPKIVDNLFAFLGVFWGIKLNTWYKLKLVAKGAHFDVYLDNALVTAFDDDTVASGRAGLFICKAHAHFDDVIITGDEIPDRGPRAIEPKSKLVTTWGKMKQAR